ncbi:MAG: right-handed parallel beta-helix repeat-containing protein, partial [Phycisphaerales bacterium]
MILTWTPGDTADVHDVYFGVDQGAVTNATRADPLGVLISQGQPQTSFALAPLERGQTYYWRIDEVEVVADPIIWEGDVWRFTVGPGIIYVDDSAVYGADNGIDWDNAYLYLQDAPAEAIAGDEIRVARGTYWPDLGGGQTLGDVEASFDLKSGVYLYGGYAGAGVLDPDARSVSGYETILSGVLGPDLHSYHVVFATSGGRLDGFTITRGKAHGPWPHNLGGGMFLDVGSSPAVANCTFGGNEAQSGGGMCNRDSDPTVTHCTFYDNYADIGGGMYNGFGSDATVTNCTFSGNDAECGGGMCNEYNASPTVINCVLWGDTGAEIRDYTGSEPSVSFCCIQGGYPGATHSIDDDPMFGNELRLSSASPCIDSGYNDAVDVDWDLDGNPRIVNGIVDMGAYEYQGPYTGIDEDGDGIEDVIDEDPLIYSNDFRDDASTETYGSIIARGDQTVAVTDVPDVGIKVQTARVAGPGSGLAVVDFCSGRFIVELGPGQFKVRGCDSEIEVLQGTITV